MVFYNPITFIRIKLVRRRLDRVDEELSRREKDLATVMQPSYTIEQKEQYLVELQDEVTRLNRERYLLLRKMERLA